jgi:hypothetical protein
MAGPASALGIRLFGFSFTAARLFMVPVDFAAVYLFYRVLAEFGVNRGNAIFATVAVFLSPLCLVLEFSAMTDIPGLMVVLLCLLLCQKAVNAATPNATVRWLCLAAATNFAGGTVRQNAWLGALVIVPCTAWLLRQRKGVLFAGVVLAIGSFAGIEAVLHWFYTLPYAVPEKLIQARLGTDAIVHLFLQYVRFLLAMQLVLLPLLLAWLWQARTANRWKLLRLAVIFMGAVYVLHHGHPSRWMMPFNGDILRRMGMGDATSGPQLLGRRAVLPLWLEIATSALCVTAGYACLEFLVSVARSRRARIAGLLRRPLDAHAASGSAAAWASIAWLLGPCFLANLLLLVPRGSSQLLYDRYWIPMLPVLFVVLLRAYQRQIATRLPAICVFSLAAFCIFAIGRTHDFFAEDRAIVAAAQQVLDTGVPATAIQGGFDYDGWTQVNAPGGHIADESFRPVFVDIPIECTSLFAYFTPSIQPRFFLTQTPLPCFEPAGFADVHYATWLPPFHRTIYVGQLRSPYNKTPYRISP